MDSQKTGKFIQALRQEKEMTQKDLAEKLGCSDKAVSRWETGKGFPDVSFLIPLGNLLQVSVNEILLGERIKKEEFKEMTDTVLVNTIQQSEHKLSRSNKIFAVLLCIVQIALFYGIPSFAQPGDEMGAIFFTVLATAVVGFVVGWLHTKWKFMFPLLCVILFLPSIVLYPILWGSWGAEETLLYMLVYAVISLIGLLPAAGIQAIVTRIVKHKQK